MKTYTTNLIKTDSKSMYKKFLSNCKKPKLVTYRKCNCYKHLLVSQILLLYEKVITCYLLKLNIDIQL